MYRTQIKPRPSARREDLRELQARWDQMGELARTRALLAAGGHNEPPLAIWLGLLVILIVTLAIGFAMVPHGWLAA